jgi:choline-sulfatase
VTAPVSLVDFAPTVLELAGLGVDAVAGEGDGVSLAGAVSGGGGSAASADLAARPVISEYHAEGVQAPSAMVRSGDHKLIVSLEDPDLLYDLNADPSELTDVSGSAEGAPVVVRLREELQARLDLPDIDERVRASQRERFLVSRALRQGRPTPWDHDPPYDAAARYIRNREDLYELQRRSRLDSATPE